MHLHCTTTRVKSTYPQKCTIHAYTYMYICVYKHQQILLSSLCTYVFYIIIALSRAGTNKVSMYIVGIPACIASEYKAHYNTINSHEHVTYSTSTQTNGWRLCIVSTRIAIYTQAAESLICSVTVDANCCEAMSVHYSVRKEQWASW